MSCYPFSAGDSAARTRLPSLACDCHIHVYDSRVAALAGARLRPPNASIDDYRQIQTRMGTTRAVVVTPSTYGLDNRLMLAALAQLGPHGRGVAVISGTESAAHLRRLHEQGVRGARVNLSLGAALHAVDSIEAIAHQIAPLGWHLQLLMPVEQLVALGPLLRRLPTPLVFDHFGRIGPAQCAAHPAHDLLLDLLAGGQAWIKLSGAYLVSASGSVEDPGLDRLARSFIDAAPERIVWGSDWPHATASAGLQAMPDDARQIDRLADWAGDARQLQQILVTNPARLYDFPTP